MTRVHSGSSAPRLQVLIIGGGFGGVGMAIRLKQSGIEEFMLLERSGDVGGCWRDNTYPGAACDVPSHLYSFSFEPKHDWSRKFAPQAEILAYIKGCVEKHGLRPHVRLNTEVASLRYDEARAVWEATTTAGDRFEARHVVTACGQLSQPAIPSLQGRSNFAGPQFHSAHWNHNLDLRGKRVAVIGTGASAIQFVPQIAPQVDKLLVFQRSAPYVLPKPDRAYRPWEQRLFKALPWLRLLTRASIYTSHEARAIGFTRFPWVMKWVGYEFKSYLRREIRDPELRRKLTPDYPPGCKRILISNDFYAALARRNVRLIDDAIDRITPEGVRTCDGREHAVDVIIYGTGFAATEFLTPMRVQGRGGVLLNDAWREGAQAYLGITVPGFPNFFMLYGPNTNLGHSSIVYMLESQIAHVLGCLRQAARAGASAIEVRDDVFRRFNDEVQADIHHTVWDGGCTSWYRNASGRNTNNWPGFTFSYRNLTRKLRAEDYVLADVR